jgi:hypothetical protein
MSRVQNLEKFRRFIPLRLPPSYPDHPVELDYLRGPTFLSVAGISRTSRSTSIAFRNFNMGLWGLY